MTNTTTQIDLDRFATKGEARAARSLVHHALRLGYSISVYDGEEWTVRRSRDRNEILSALASTGMDIVAIHPHAPGAERQGIAARFWLIYGNDESGDELISDYTANDAAEELYRMVYRDRDHD